MYTSQLVLLSLVITTAMSDKSPPCLTENLSTYFFKAKNLISFKLQSSFNLRLQIPVTAVKHSCQNCLPKRTQLRTQSLAKNVRHKNCGRKTILVVALALELCTSGRQFFSSPSFVTHKLQWLLRICSISIQPVKRQRECFAFICSALLPTSGGRPSVNVSGSMLDPLCMFKLLQETDPADLCGTRCHLTG